jgi:hypothetical protein
VISREDALVQSTQDHLRHVLYDTFNYPPTKVEIVDGFDARLFDEKFGDAGLDHTYIAVAYQFDDGGTPVELGSTLTAFLHTIDFLVLGHTPTWGRNVAHVVKAALWTDEGYIPLRNYEVAGTPIVGKLPIEEASTQREFTFEPRPWSAFAWTTRLRVTDELFATT